MVQSPMTIIKGVMERMEAAAEYSNERGASEALQSVYSTMSDAAVVAQDVKDDMDKRFRQASEVAMAIFRKADGDLAKVERANEAIARSKLREGDMSPSELIAQGTYWSSEQKRAVDREHILNWCTASYDIADGDRFWSAPKAFVGIAKVPTATSQAWMLTAYRDGRCVSSQQTEHAFELMLFIDRWLTGQTP